MKDYYAEFLQNTNTLKSEVSKVSKGKKNLLNQAFDTFDTYFHQVFEKNSIIGSITPVCSNCDLEMKLIENDTLWFCPLGCSKKTAEQNKDNEFVDSYNAKLEKVLNDEKLYADFETTIDEQKAILIINGKHSEADAERIVSDSQNFREIVLGLFG